MKQPNIILISIDTLRADHVSCYGYHRHTTPNLDRLASEGAQFSNAYSTAVWTPPAHASMLTGLYPSAHNVVDYQSLSPRIPTIAQVLARNGYQTVGFVNNPAVGAFVGLERGHQTFHEIWKGVTSGNPFIRGAHFLYRQLLNAVGISDQGARKTQGLIRRWLDVHHTPDSPFYMFIHHIEPHNPLAPPRPFRGKFKTSELAQAIDAGKLARMADNPLVYFTDSLKMNAAENQTLIDLYDCEIAYADHVLGQTFDLLRDRGLLNNSLVIVTADHGEHFGEHGLYSHVSSLYEPIVHIPFIVRYPAAFQPAVYDCPVQHIDIFPTVLDMLNIEENLCRSLPGQSLLPANGQLDSGLDRPVFAEWEGRIPGFVKARLQDSDEYAKKVRRFTHKFSMVKVRSHKYIYWEDGLEELYDISHDPGELKDLSKEAPEICKSMRALLTRTLNVNKRQSGEKAAPVDDLVLQRLKDLGYI